MAKHLMSETQIRSLEDRADNLRFVLDLVASAMDERLPDSEREMAAERIMENSQLFRTMCEARETFRDVANLRTDAALGSG
jgi:hypothetical protein